MLSRNVPWGAVLQRSTSLCSHGSTDPWYPDAHRLIELCRSSSYLLPSASKTTCCSAAHLCVATGRTTRGLMNAEMIELCRSSSYLLPPASKTTCCSAALLYVATGLPTRGLMNADIIELCRSSSYELRLPPVVYIFYDHTHIALQP